MAWNEPGGPDGRDPWGNRKNDQGPPDLDEVVRKLQSRLNRLFGGKGDVSGSGVGMGGVALILVLALAIWALSGFYIIDEGKRGVVLRFGAYQETTGPGLHWYPRLLDQVKRVDVGTIRSLEVGYRADESLMLTQDENIVDIKFAVQYRVGDPRAYLFNTRDPDDTLREALESAVREVVGKSKMDFVITGGRAEVVAQAQKLLQQIADEYGTGLVVTSLNMQDAQAPQQVQDAFADAVKAREDEARQKNEAEAYANDVLPKARGAAARIIEEANAYKERVIAEAEGNTSRFLQVYTEYRKAPAITRKRLYLDAMESVLSKSSKVVVDTRNSNNLLYLPLDKLGGRMGMPTTEVVPSSGGADARSAAAPIPEAPTQAVPVREDLRRREVR